MVEVDNSILEAAVSIVDSDETRQFYLACEDTYVDANLFMKHHKGMCLASKSLYVYKNLELYVT